uniref:Leucyl/cystinyl aminopeptidase n=1 Tax=Oncorhynchus kisutch TaxID=8019 RepID=A0A8C7LEH5_ONCKI
THRASLPRNMIENTMFEEEPDVVDLAKDSTALEPDEVVYEPRSSRLLVRGLGENDLDDEEEDYESSARLLGMSFMNRSSTHNSSSSPYNRQAPPRLCSCPSARMLVVGVFILVLVASMAMALYFLPGCTFTKAGCGKANSSIPMEPSYPNSTNGELFPWNELRLPASVRPVNYDLSLTPNLTSMTFTGRTVINMTILHDTKRIVLHSSELIITKATFQVDKSVEVKVLEYKPWQQIAVSFLEDLKVGQVCVLTLDYAANLSHTYDGFYNSSYNDKTGAKRVLAATQFEPQAARKAFPCFDEPAFKATFLVRITREPGYITLSNMPQAKTTTLPSGLLEDEFEQTAVNMSTYLVAFIVANFTSITRNVSVYSVPEKKEHTHYALDTASTLLHFYNTFFHIDYPLRKLDLVAIPDFLAGAMENWGLITFRETSLLVGNQSSPLDKQLIANVVAHELAHQWFGNLVTMRWWNDLWLNEGFATYWQYTSLMTEFPQLDLDNVFLGVRFKAMAKDSLNSSHPVSVSSQVTTPEQVSEMFDSVTYEKGASLLLMLKTTLPDGQFRKGIIKYLDNYRGSNTVTEDLWNSLTQVGVESVSDMMRTWTLQNGFPLVTVSRKGGHVTLTQEPFLPTFLCVLLSLWHIPVTYVNDNCSSAPSCRQIFTLRNKTATLNVSDSVKWLKLNYMNTGFYIVHYGDEGWATLIDALKTDINTLTPHDRASLIHNIFALSRSVLGRVSFRQVLNLLDYTTNETETAPLTEALSQLSSVYRLLDKRQEQRLLARMKVYIWGHFGQLMDSQDWGEEESVSRQELRSVLLEMACSLGRQNCTDQATALYDQWTNSNQTKQIPGDLQQVVFSTAAQADLRWLSLMEAYSSTTYDSEKRKILQALASTQDPRSIVWILSTGLEGGIIQTQELPLVISTVSDGFAGHLLVWDFVKENWDRIIEKFPVGSYPIQSIIKSTTSQFSTQTHLEEVQGFFSSLKERGSQMRSVQESLETIRLNQLWMDRNLPTLRIWL